MPGSTMKHAHPTFPYRRPAAGSLHVAAVLAFLPAAVGCATWLPWTSPDQARKNAERYGPTANQRIKSLQDEAQQAQAADDIRRAEFTRGLPDTLLAEHDARVRCEIVAIAGDFDTSSALAICRGALEDPDSRVRARACEVWSERGGKEAVDLLAIRYRTDRDLDVRLRALKMLGQLGDRAAIPVLAEALENPDPAVQYRAVAALKRVSGRDLGNDVNAWREWAADPERGEAWSIAETFRKLF